MASKTHIHLHFFFSSRRRHTRFKCDWSSDVCSSDLCYRRSLNRRLLGRRKPLPHARRDRKSVVEGKSVDLGGRRIIKKKNTQHDVSRCQVEAFDRQSMSADTYVTAS